MIISIKGLDSLPENCRECPICKYANRTVVECGLMGSRFDPEDYGGKHSACRLEEVESC